MPFLKFFWRKLGEKESQTTHNTDIFKTLNFCISILTRVTHSGINLTILGQGSQFSTEAHIEIVNSWKISIKMAEQDPKSDVQDWIDQVLFTKLTAEFHSLPSPWWVSEKVEKSEMINKILAHSLVVQSSRIPQSSHPNLPSYIFSNGCIIICELLRYYLSWLDIDAKVYCGTIYKGRGNGIMHVFLELDNEIGQMSSRCTPSFLKFNFLKSFKK